MTEVGEGVPEALDIFVMTGLTTSGPPPVRGKGGEHGGEHRTAVAKLQSTTHQDGTRAYRLA